MEPFSRTSLYSALTLLIALCSSVELSLLNSSESIRQPFHLTWTPKNNSRFDIIFSVKGPLKNDSRPYSLANNNLSDALVACTNYSACLIENELFVRGYNLTNTASHEFVFVSASSKRTTITIHHYCSTHWNPPAHLWGDRNSSHTIEWHSPYSCPSEAINHERPCYVYDSNGSLIDLTPWVFSNGSSHAVDTGTFKDITKFNLNVCNEASSSCGPNVASCYVDSRNHVESGFNNLTSIKYDSKGRVVLLTLLGQSNNQCPEQRVKTIVRFICKDKVLPQARPLLTHNSPCKNIIDWQTIHACPMPEIRVPATKCALEHDGLGLNFNLTELTKGLETIKVANISINGIQKSMMLGLCRGIKPSVMKCEGKQNSLTSACLYDELKHPNKTIAVNNSEIVGSNSKSYIRLADDRIYLESFAPNKTCQILSAGFNETRQVGTRIEFFCSSKSSVEPSFLGFRDCTYVFEWASEMMCLESHGADTSTSPGIKKTPTSAVHTASKSGDNSDENIHKLSDDDLRINIDEKLKTAEEMHRQTLNDSMTLINTVSANKTKAINAKIDSEENKKSKVEPVAIAKQVKDSNRTTSTTPTPVELKTDQPNQPQKMNKFHKFFMIGLIMTSLVAFVAVIFILDKKTRLRIPLNNIRHQVRQAFQPQPVPYTRVDQFNDNLVL